MRNKGIKCLVGAAAVARMKEDQEPTHGYCEACGGPIEKPSKWTLTKRLNRVHADTDECVEYRRTNKGR